MECSWVPCLCRPDAQSTTSHEGPCCVARRPSSINARNRDATEQVGLYMPRATHQTPPDDMRRCLIHVSRHGKHVCPKHEVYPRGSCRQSRAVATCDLVSYSTPTCRGRSRGRDTGIRTNARPERSQPLGSSQPMESPMFLKFERTGTSGALVQPATPRVSHRRVRLRREGTPYNLSPRRRVDPRVARIAGHVNRPPCAMRRRGDG